MTRGEGSETPLLQRISGPRDVQALSLDQLQTLADEVRRKIIGVASENGGHLAPHLGVVELTLALHHVFDLERDRLILDVGHQCYAHKLLTGRVEGFEQIRKRGGYSGYPKRSESRYDAFGTGHSSTSISAGLGMAVARDRAGESHKVVSVIGDGAMTAGEAFEGLANAGTIGTDLLVILNDNKMSISPNVGALSAYFSRLITHGLYNKARHDIRDLMERALGKHVTSAAQKLEHSVKGFLTPGTMFEQLGFRYVGPVDGHDIPTLVECLANLRDFRGPVFFHVVTQKGKGYPYAEEDPLKYHGVKAFDIQTGRFRPAAPTDAPVPSFTDAFADGMLEAMRADERVVGITAAMPTGTGLSKVENAFPDRVFDVGICEQHAVTFAAGLAADGQRPVAAIYSTFLQRGYDQLLHDVCLQNLPVVFAIDRAGPVGEDSPTQQGAFDLSFLRCVPNLTILAPRDALDLKQMLHWALKQDGPVAIRYARSAAPTLGEAKERDVTRATLLREGTDGAFFALGPAVAPSLEAAALLAEEGLEVAVADARLVKPLDTDMLRRLARRPMVTVEENSVVGGLGTAVMEWAEDEGLLGELRLARAGFPDRFLDHATRAEQLEEIGLEAHRLAEKMRALLHRHADADTTV